MEPLTLVDFLLSLTARAGLDDLLPGPFPGSRSWQDSKTGAGQARQPSASPSLLPWRLGFRCREFPQRCRYRPDCCRVFGSGQTRAVQARKFISSDASCAAASSAHASSRSRSCSAINGSRVSREAAAGAESPVPAGPQAFPKKYSVTPCAGAFE